MPRRQTRDEPGAVELSACGGADMSRAAEVERPTPYSAFFSFRDPPAVSGFCPRPLAAGSRALRRVVAARRFAQGMYVLQWTAGRTLCALV